MDVTEREDIKFDSDKSGIGKKAEFQGTVEGEIVRSFPSPPMYTIAFLASSRFFSLIENLKVTMLGSNSTRLTNGNA